MLDILHKNDIIHTNLCPENIFLLDGQVENMCFQNFHHCSWNTSKILCNPYLGPECEDNLSLYDIRTRNQNYISPEQIELGHELANIVDKKNGKLDENTYDIAEFLLMKKH